MPKWKPPARWLHYDQYPCTRAVGDRPRLGPVSQHLGHGQAPPDPLPAHPQQFGPSPQADPIRDSLRTSRTSTIVTFQNIVDLFWDESEKVPG